MCLAMNSGRIVASTAGLEGGESSESSTLTSAKKSLAESPLQTSLKDVGLRLVDSFKLLRVGHSLNHDSNETRHINLPC